MKPTIAESFEGIAARTRTAPSTDWALASLALCMLLSSLGTSIANVGLPTLTIVFDAYFGQVQWVVLAYLLTSTALIVSVGRLGDILGRRRLLLSGIVLFSFASASCGMAPSLGLLIAARAVQGLGAAIMMALSMALVGETVSKEKTGAAMGLLGTMSAIGTALGPSLGGVLLAGLGWRAIFLVNVPLGCLTYLLARRALPVAAMEPKMAPVRIDGMGILLLALILGAYTLAMTTGHGSYGTLNICLLLAALIGGGIFARVEARTTSPLISLATFRNFQLNISLATNMLVSTVMMATLVVGPFYLSLGLRLDLVLVGAAMTLGPLISVFCGVPSGHLVDRHGSSLISIVGLITMLTGCVALSMLPALFGIFGYIVAITVLTPGYALFQAANNTSVMMDVTPGNRGVVSGLLNLSRNLGLITGASAMGAVFTYAVATVDIVKAPTEAIVHGLQMTFATASGLIGAALAILIASRVYQERAASSENKSR
jgi:MFS family permease